MAKKRRFKARSGGFGRRMKARRSHGGEGNPLKVVLPALVYGASRGYISNAIKPFTDKIPLGNYADEVVFGTAGYLMAKKGKGIVKSAGMAILTVEAASLGSQIIGQVVQTPMTDSYDSSY